MSSLHRIGVHPDLAQVETGRHHLPRVVPTLPHDTLFAKPHLDGAPDPTAAERIQHEGLFSSQKETGMGIGLYLSNASVEQFGGAIHLSARSDGGSVCRIRLPLKDQRHFNSNLNTRMENHA